MSKNIFIIFIVISLAIIFININYKTMAVKAEETVTEENNVIYVQSTDDEPIQVPVPKGYTASQVQGETTVNGGFVIYEGDIDWNTIELDENAEQISENKISVFELQSSVNQYVWVPVNDITRIYGIDEDGKLWSKLYNYSATQRTPANWTETDGILNVTTNKEPDVLKILTRYDIDSNLESTLEGKTRFELLSKELEQNYYLMIKSVTKYGGFYLGRYETGGLSETIVIQKMNEDIDGQSWYTNYEKCKDLSGENTNVITSMIWGNLYDETLQWIIESGAKSSEGKPITYELIGGNSRTIGNFKDSVFEYITTNGEIVTKAEKTSVKIPTGSSEYTKINNIYDLAGNVYECTLETYTSPIDIIYSCKVLRSGYYSTTGTNSAGLRGYINDQKNPDGMRKGKRLQSNTLNKKLKGGTMKKSKKKILLIVIFAILTIIGIILFQNRGKIDVLAKAELSRTQEYLDVMDGDEIIEDTEGNILTQVKFDAFFLKDKDEDGVAESIRGTCNKVGTQATLYMDVNVIDEGYVKNGKLTINSNNFYFKTTIVADDEVSQNYISSNTKEINLNEIQNGTEKLIMGSVCSGNYTSSNTVCSAIGNDTNKYSMENSIIFSGIYVDINGNEIAFTKEVSFEVDWYGEVNAEIYDNSSLKTIEVTELDNLINENNELNLNFTIATAETKNELIMAGSYISGTIPKLNGYMPTSVKITGTNVTYEYNDETGEFTAQREAILNNDGIVTSNAYSESYYKAKRNYYYFTVTYPIEAYEEFENDISSIQISIPIEAVNKGYNNPNIDDGFENPYISETVETTIVRTWKKYDTTTLPYFTIYVGTYRSSPYYTYVISKEKPLNIYNGISLEETDDTYIVQWRAYTGTNGITDGIVMEEATDITDQFLNTSDTYISMDELTTNKGIYFSGATPMLGSEGWIKVYDADTDILLKTFDSSNWNLYTILNPYIYENTVKHIRIETSSTNEESYFSVSNIKELDDEYITENFTREEFDSLSYIYSYLDGYMIGQGEGEEFYYYESNISSRALYAMPTSVATISLSEDTISTQKTTENEKITITTVTTEYNQQKWKNGTFLVQLPIDIILAEINSVTTDNENVTISAYDIYEEDGNYYIKILTKNDEEASYTITIDCNLTPDPRIIRKTGTVKLYATNEIACDYHYSLEDICDIDGDLNVTEKVNYKTTLLTLEPGTILSTTQIASKYDDTENITIAPRITKADKNQRTATITVSVTNNYTYGIKDIKIQGVIPFEGNNTILSNQDLESEFTTYINSKISAKTEEVKDYITIYYSTNENPTNDITLATNGWILEDDIEDWTSIKTYIIVIDSSYIVETGKSIEFEYEIYLPEGIDYNKVSYSAHGVYFALDTEEGLYYTSTASAKLGFIIAKQYDLEITKYQEDTDKKIQGVTFTITEEGAETSTIKVTDANGGIEVKGLYAERCYIIQEIETTDDYVLNDTPVKLYTYEGTDNDGNKNLYVVYVNKDGSYSQLTDVYDFVKSTYTDSTTTKVNIEIENEVKVKLKIVKTDEENGELLKNVRFTLTGKGQNEAIITTNLNGEIDVSGLYLGEKYTLTEIKATNYYIPDENITFTITNNEGIFEVNCTNNGTIKNAEITTEEEIPILTLNLENEKIPTYGLQLTKYAQGEETTLKGAQFKIYGEGIDVAGKIYTTNANGILTIDGLYEYVADNGEAKGGITGEYRLVEIYAPEGYSLDSTELRFKAYRENGELKVEILEGENIIRTITDSNADLVTVNVDLTIANASEKYPTIQIGIENTQIFSIFKYTTKGTEKVALPGTKFVITDLDGDIVTGSDGKIVGEWDETIGNYVLTTDSNGKITANLAEGLYKAIEVYTDEKYILEESEEDRTYYFGIGTRQKEVNAHWFETIVGNGWNYVEDIETTEEEGIITVGSFSEYTIDGIDGVDVDKDGEIEAISKGVTDGLIVVYDSEGKYLWSKTLGGDNYEELTKITKTSDGGYIITGYVVSETIYYNGTEVSELSINNTEALANKDGIIIKIDSIGNYEWGIRLGGKLDDEITSVIETSEGNIAIAGKFKSNIFNFYETNGETVDTLNSRGSIDTFIAVYSKTGKYQWSQHIGGNYYDEAIDIVETTTDYGEKTLVVAVNYEDIIYLNTDNTISQIGSSSSSTNGLVIGYNSDGTYLWRYRFYSSSSDYNVEISALDVDNSGNIIVAIEYAYKLEGNLNESDISTTIIETNPVNKIYDASIVKLGNDGTYQDLIYTLSGNYEEYIADVKATSNGGILLGGWYYSTKGIDVDGDGNFEGEYDYSEVSGQYKSDGFFIKLNKENIVTYSNRIYGDGYDCVTTVTELSNGTSIAGGVFDSTTLYASVFDEEADVEIATKVRYTDAFIIAEGKSLAEVPELQSLNIENKVKTFKITTQVKNYEVDSNFDGGTITGEAGIHDNVTYTLDGIRYIETVEYGENSENAITITPEEGYSIAYIKINDVEYTTYTLNEDGTITIPIFEEITEDICIVVEFSNTISSIEVNHYLWTESEGITEIKVAKSEIYSGKIGDTYTALPVTDIDYDIITNADYYRNEELNVTCELDDYYIPSNYTGIYKSGEVQVINYYYKAKTYTLTVHHYLAGTSEQVPAKDEGTVADEITEGYTKNQEYKTTQSDLIDYDIYELVEIPENSEGTIEENTEVTYYYQIKTVNLSITKVAEEDYSQVLSGTEFALYKLTGISDESLINTKDVGDEWTLVGTYTTSSTGILKLENLQITSEYRLVETKASKGRMKPKGQWKVELIYGDYDETDTSIISVNGTALRVTAIGNPPALVLNEGTLLLPNREYYKIPASGDIGIGTFYKIGISLTGIGLMLFILYKKNKERKN